MPIKSITVRPLKIALFRLQVFLQFVFDCLRKCLSGKQYVGEIVHQLNRIGVDSLFIISLTGLFTGMVFTLQTGTGLQRFGAAYTVGKIVALGIIKELGPVLTALVFAGRAGSGIAAQLSSMVVTEQIDAIEAEGIDPIRRVVVARVIACTVMLPLMTIIADAVALIGGAVICAHSLGVSTTLYWSDVFSVLERADLLMGAVKPVVFGLVVALSGSFYGMHAERDARGVGFATTRAVVSATIIIILLDFLVTKIMILMFGS
jgi:phospholipid/cholesterol/gamma-HCH transport system permease protein